MDYKGIILQIALQEKKGKKETTKVNVNINFMMHPNLIYVKR